MLVAGALALLVTIAAVAFAATRGDTNSPPGTKSVTHPPGSVVHLDPETGEHTTIFVASSPDVFTTVHSNHGLVVGQGGVWVLHNAQLFHLDPLHEEVRRRIVIGSSFNFATNVAEGLEAIWVVNEGGLYRVNPATDEHRLYEPFPPVGIATADVAVGAGYVWVSTSTGRLMRLEPRAGQRTWLASLDPINSIAFGHGAVWTIDALHGTVTRWDPVSMRRQDVIALSGEVDALVVGDQHVWVLSRNVGSLAQIDVNRGEVAQTARVGRAPTALAAGLGAVWVDDEDGVIRRVDENTLEVTEIPFGAKIRAIAVDEETETLWVGVA